MSLLIILSALAGEHLLAPYEHLRRGAWFEAWIEIHQALPAGRLGNGWSGLAGLLGLPLLCAAWLQGLFDAFLFGLPGLAFSAVVLLYSLGPRSLWRELERLLGAVERRDRLELGVIAADLRGGPLAPGEDDLPMQALWTVFAATQERLFGPLVWFVLLGPVGALAYRLSSHLARHLRIRPRPGLEEAARRWLWLLDWLPSRSAAALYALSGHFQGALRAWKGCRPEPPNDPQSGKAPALCAGVGALDDDRLRLVDRPQGPWPAETFKDALALIRRALALALLLLAIADLAGLVGH